MSDIVIELNDTGVTAADESGILLVSPGYAIVEPKRLTVGEAAFRSARLNPRWTNNRFWNELSLEPVDKPTAQVRSHADLAYAHLDELAKKLDAGSREVIFAVPGSFDNHQLALLLGIARECSLKVAGLVDAAVAAATQVAADADLLYLDVLLHRAVITRIRRAAQLTRAGVDDVRKGGLAALHERWVDLIADTYVNHTRFDPLHLAETEQALYDRLPAWLEELAKTESTLLEMQSGPKTHRVSLSRESLIDRVKGHYAAIADQLLAAMAGRDDVALAVTDRAARLPGLTALLADATGVSPVVLAPDATPRGVLTHIEHIRSSGEALSFVTALPAAAVAGKGSRPDARPEIRQARDPAREPTPPPPVAAPAPSHLLYRSRAYAIGPVAFRIGRGDEGLRLGTSLNGAEAVCSVYARGPRIVLENHGADGAFVNERRVEGRVQLALGDRLRIGPESGEELELIALVNGDGP